MKRILFMLLPLVIVLLAYHPGTVHEVKGIVRDETGKPLVGVSVTEFGTRNATTTGKDGGYVINLSDANAAIQFSAVGYVSQTIRVKGKSTIHVSLKPEVNKLEEVVVLAQGYVADQTWVDHGKALVGHSPGVAIYGSRAGDREQYIRKERQTNAYNTEDYDHITENSFLKVSDNPLSTFSIDVDAASYSNVRRYLNQGQIPPTGAVRIEEMINYFQYDYPQPTSDRPFSINTEISDAPWNGKHKLVLVGLQGKKIPTQSLPPSNLVFLIDVSGSMDEPNKLPLVRSSMKMLVDQLREEDHVSIVVYAGAAGLVLKPTSGENKTRIKEAIDNLEAGGSTAGGAGIRLAYKVAKEHFIESGNNRVILCTDGDFNVGESSNDAMERLIEKERESGLFLTVLGYGTGNYKDNRMQNLADKGNGNHAYIDGIMEAKKVLVNEFGGTLFTIAKDVKLQVEFNPAKVQAYRLIGYENRMLAKEDFNDDEKDAGELGSGHTVTALYEVIPVGVKSSFLKNVDPLKYQSNETPLSRSSQTDEIMTVKFRYKAPDASASRLIEHPLKDNQLPIHKTSDNYRFAAAVAEFGLLLRNSSFKSDASYENVIRLATRAKGKDPEGYRGEFLRLVESAGLLAGTNNFRDEDEITPGR
jgi:Ca-activated chloride channel family protein